MIADKHPPARVRSVHPAIRVYVEAIAALENQRVGGDGLERATETRRGRAANQVVVDVVQLQILVRVVIVARLDAPVVDDVVAEIQAQDVRAVRARARVAAVVVARKGRDETCSSRPRAVE